MKKAIIPLIACCASTYIGAQTPAAKPARFDTNTPNVSKMYFGLKPNPAEYNFITEYETLKNTKLDKVDNVYDLREIESGKFLTPVKAQGNSNTCWTFATMGAVESYILKKSGGTFNFSEQNMATCNGYSKDPDSGGNTTMAISYFANLKGPVNETDAPFTLPGNEECALDATPQKYVQQLRIMPGKGDASFNPLAIKNAIIENGALYTNLYMHDNYFNTSDNTYYYSGSNTSNHAVLIVGWDDNKVVTGKNSGKPSKKGAWIIRNSWGTHWGEKGFFYVSYEDSKALTHVAFFPSNIEYNKDVKAYYFDESGMTSSTGFRNDEAYGLIRFSVGANETIDKFGLHVRSGNAEIEATVYESFNKNTLSGKLGNLTKKTLDYPGFHTLKLDTPIDIEKDMDVYVKYRVKTPSYNYPLSREGIESGYNDYSSIEENRCWVSSSGTSWTAYGKNTNRKYDLCARIYTKPKSKISSTTKTNSTSGISIYPNPSNGNINISLIGNPGEKIQLKIFATSGQLIYSINSTVEKPLLVKDLLPGIYLVNVRIGEEISTSKLLIQ